MFQGGWNCFQICPPPSPHNRFHRSEQGHENFSHKNLVHIGYKSWLGVWPRKFCPQNLFLSTIWRTVKYLPLYNYRLCSNSRRYMYEPYGWGVPTVIVTAVYSCVTVSWADLPTSHYVFHTLLYYGSPHDKTYTTELGQKHWFALRHPLTFF